MAHDLAVLIQSNHNADQTQGVENKLHVLMESSLESQCKGCEYRKGIDLGNFYNQPAAPIVLVSMLCNHNFSGLKQHPLLISVYVGERSGHSLTRCSIWNLMSLKSNVGWAAVILI